TTNKSYYSADYCENITLYVNYTSVLNSTPIINADINISGQESLKYTIIEVGNGIYSIEINVSTESKAYNILITANKTGFEQKSVAFVVSVNLKESSLQFVSGDSTIYFGDNLTFLVLYSKPSDSNINYTGAMIKVSTEMYSDYWTEDVHFRMIDNLNGTYTIIIFTGQSMKINNTGQFIIHIHANRTDVQEAILSYNIYINPIQASLTTNKSYYSVKYCENISLYINYTAVINSTPILNANMNISGQESLRYTIRESGNGIYIVELNVSTISKTYNILVTANKMGYEQKSVSFIISVNLKDSLLQYISGNSSTYFRDNLTLLVLYSDPSDTNINYTQSTVRISSEISSDYWVENVHFKSIDNKNGTYTIIIFTGELMKINRTGQYVIHIHANRTDVQEAILSYNIYINPIQASLTTNKSYYSANYCENVTLYLNYTTVLNSTPIINADISISGQGSLNYTINEVGNGIYSIEINVSTISTTYTIIVIANRTGFEQKTVSFIISVNLKPSSLQFISGNNTVYFRQNLTLLVLYSDPIDPNINYTGATILISSEMYSNYWSENVHFSSVDNLNGTYTITIFTGSSMKVNESGQVVVHIYAIKSNIQNATLSYSFYVNPIQTDLTTNKSTFYANYFENVTFFVNYTESSSIMPVLNANINISGHENLNYTIKEIGNGIYSIEINVSSIGKVYNIIITASATNFEQKSIAFILLVNIPESQLSYVSGQSEVNFRDNLTLTLIYSSPTDPNINYTGATIQISSKTYSNYWTLNVHYIVVDNLNGTYTLTIFTGESMKINESGQAVIYIHAQKTNVQNATLSYNIFVNPIGARLTTNQSFISIEINKNVSYFVNFTSEIDFSPLIGANIYLTGQENLSYSIKEIGNGIYSIEINASNEIKTYNLFISANKSGYELKTVAVVLTVNPPDSMLQYISGQTTINFRENLTLILLYSKLNEPQINYTGANFKISSELFSDYWTENVNYKVIDNANGTYTLIIFTGELERVNTTGQNIIHIHANKTGVKNATLSYTFYINPISTEIIINETIFEIPKYEAINFTIKYQTKVGAIPLDNANITVFGYSNYSIISLTQGYYNIKLIAINETGSHSISIIVNKQNYAIKSIDIVLIIRALDQFTKIKTNTSANSVYIGSSTEFVFSFYYSYSGEYFTDQNITVKYEWQFGTGTLTVQNNTKFVLQISTNGIPAGQYPIKILVYDKDNVVIGENNVYLIVNAIPVSPWIYMIIGASVILLATLITLTYYYKVQKPRKIFKNKLLMEKYYKYVDSHNLQRLLIIDKNSGLKISSKNYGSTTDIDEDLVSGFIQAISNFGQEISKLDTAVMENITYKGFKILLESGKYVDICLLLKEHETYTLKDKIRLAREEFENTFSNQLQNFTGNIKVFTDIYSNFDEKFEIYLTGNFQINYKMFAKKSKSLNNLQKKIMRLIISVSEKPFKISEILELAKNSKIKAPEPVVFSNIYDFIKAEIIVPYL
ncbi:MAG: hypothetical protein ACTSXT_17090, partial [Candidatus Helarchaeota archaeon]